jgi:tetratricopeptide (TPR) repeat protein
MKLTHAVALILCLLAPATAGAQVPDPFERGRSLTWQGDLPGAVVALSRALERDPGNAQIFLYRGAVYDLQREPDMALADYSAAIALDRGLVEAYFRRAEIYRSKRDLGAALADFDRILKIRPDNFHALYRRGYLSAAQGKTEAAVADFERASVVAPDADLGRAALAAAKRVRGQLTPDDVLADLEAFASGRGNLSPEFFVHRGNLHHRAGRYVEALADFDRALELDPRNPFAFLLRGGTRRAKGNTAGAVSDFSRAIELNPRVADAFLGRGLARLSLGQADEARQDFARAVAVDPDLGPTLARRVEAETGHPFDPSPAAAPPPAGPAKAAPSPATMRLVTLFRSSKM